MTKACPHVSEIRDVTPSSWGCEDCLRAGRQDWVHLRVCLECGHVGCCDSSPRKHATGHFHQTQHPIARSFEPGETWSWCYVDEVMLEGLPGPAPGPAHRRRPEGPRPSL